MMSLRILGNTIQREAEKKNLSLSDIAGTIGCTENQVRMLYRGRSICSFDQLEALAEKFTINVEDLINDEKSELFYADKVIHLTKKFSSNNNREKILDIIYKYLDICDLVSK